MNLKNKQALYLLFSASMISNVAQGFTLLSIPWYFAQFDKSHQFNLAYAGITLASLFWSLFAGTIVDRYNRKKLFLLLNAIQGFLLFMAAEAGYYLGYMPHWITAGVFMVTILGFSIHFPNMYALLQSITTSDNYTKVTSIIEIIGQSMTVVSGALITFLLEGYRGEVFNLGWSVHIPSWSMADIFLLDGCTYYISLLLISFMQYEEIKTRTIERGSVWKRLRSGLRFLSDHRFILIFGLASYAVFAVMIVELHGLMPAYVKDYLGESARVIGIAEIFYGGGALLAGVFVGRLFNRLSKLQGVLLLMLLSTIAFFSASLTTSVGIFIFLNILWGFSNAGVRVLRVAWLFNHVPNEVIGRVNSVFSMANTTARVAFLALFGLPFFTDGSHIIWAYILSGGFVFIAWSSLMFYKSSIEKISRY